MGRKRSPKEKKKVALTPSVSRSYRRLEWSVLGLALVLRIGGSLSLAQTPFVEHLLVDAYTYWNQALQILSGKDPFALGFYQPPGYPVFLVFLTRIFEADPPSMALVRAVQALFGLFTTWGIMRLGRRMGAHFSARWVGAVAGLLYTLYPRTILFEQDLLTPALCSALLVSSLLLVIREGGPGPWRSFFAGLLLGCATVVHTTYLLVALVLAVGVWAWRKPLRVSALWVLAGLALALAPTTAVNASRFGEFTLVSDNAGLNFYLGNNPDWKRTTNLQAGLPFRQLVLEAEPHVRTFVHERNSYWRERALSEIVADPGAWIGAIGTKAYYSVHNTEIPRNEDYRCRTKDGALRWIVWLPVRYGWVFPLALWGGVILWRRGREFRLVPVSWVALHLPLVVFFVSDRYRIATWPVVCLAAALGIQAAWKQIEAWREGERPSRRWLWLLVAVVPWLPRDAGLDMQESWCLRVEGNFARADRDLDTAIERYQLALDLNPEDMSARHHLAEALVSQGRPTAAEEVLEPLLASFPQSYRAQKLMARIQVRLKNWEGVAEHAGAAWRLPHEGLSAGVLYVDALLKCVPSRREEALAVVEASPALAAHSRVQALLGR